MHYSRQERFEEEKYQSNDFTSKKKHAPKHRKMDPHKKDKYKNF